MEDVKEDLLRILNQALKLEQSAKVKYSSRAEMITALLKKIEEKQMSKSIKEISGIDIRDEQEAIAFYRRIRNRVGEYRKELQNEFKRIELAVHHVIQDEEEHSERLSLFIKQLEEMVENRRGS
jgi:rubrerythrin